MSPQHPGRIQLPVKPRTQARGSLRTHEQRRIFYAKLNADWIFNLAGLLAFNFLLSLFPLMLLLLAGAGFTLPLLSPTAIHTLENNIEAALPNGIGAAAVTAATENLRRSAGIILIIGVLAALLIGSRLFIAMESCFCVIYRTRPRTFFQRNILAISMTVALAFSGQLLFLASFIPTTMAILFLPVRLSVLDPLVVQIIGSAVSFVIAFLFFGLIYYIIPNRRFRFQEVWRGAALAAALLLAYESLFPLYATFILRPNAYGSLAGFVILLLVFLYYLALILLLGAEINAWESGLRDPRGGFALYLRARAAMDSAIRRKELPPDTPYFEE